MKDTKLIIVSGASGTGKSTTSQKLAQQYQKNGIKHLWLHEEIKDHPIREEEFSIGNLYSEEGMDKNILHMYNLWESLVDKIEKSDKIYLMEGCLYQNIIRYFFPCNYPIEKITQFYDSIMKIIEKLNPTIVFLYRSDMRESFEKAFKVRGERWKNIILNKDNNGLYFTKHKYEGDDSIYAMEVNYQEIANEMFKRYQGNKIKIDTADELWENHMENITQFLGLEYNHEETMEIEYPLDKYCGKYSIRVNEYDHVLVIKSDSENENLYCQTSWWENMKLIPLGNNEFQMLSFPIKLSFQFHNDKKAMHVTGVYDWSIMGETMWEI